MDRCWLMKWRKRCNHEIYNLYKEMGLTRIEKTPVGGWVMWWGWKGVQESNERVDRRPVGRPRERWLDAVDKDAEMQELEKAGRGQRCLEVEDWIGQGQSWDVVPQKKKKQCLGSKSLKEKAGKKNRWSPSGPTACTPSLQDSQSDVNLDQSSS